MARLQTRFAAHIRDPDNNPVPEGIESRRMGIYTELFFNSISSLLAGTFPVIHELLDENRWDVLVRAFYRSGAAHTPYFPEIPRDFVRWLGQENPLPEKPFLPELAHYEWLELAVQIDKSPWPECAPFPADSKTALKGTPRLSPWVQLGSYRFPVHRIKSGFEPEKPDQNGHFFLVYRAADKKDREQEQVRFLNINAVSALLYAAIKDNPKIPLQALLAEIATQIGHTQPELLHSAALEVLKDWHTRGIVAGYD